MAEKKSAEKKPPDGPSFEEALHRLEGIVHVLEEGEVGLDEALRRYEEGVKLLRQAYDLLQQAERKIELLGGSDARGNPICRPFDDQGALPLDQKARSRSQRRSAAQPEAGDSGID